MKIHYSGDKNSKKTFRIVGVVHNKKNSMMGGQTDHRAQVWRWPLCIFCSANHQGGGGEHI